MRVTEDRYVRELRQINLAQRLIRHEVRSATIQRWTALTEDRVRNLVRASDGQTMDRRRHRGPPPKSVEDFLRQNQLRSEGSAMCAFAYLYGVMPAKPLSNAHEQLPSVAGGERLCRAYELYRRLIPGSRLTLEQTMFLLESLAEGIEARLGQCAHCRGTLLLDLSHLKRDICYWCQQHEAAYATSDEPEEASSLAPPLEDDGIQHQLF